MVLLEMVSGAGRRGYQLLLESVWRRARVAGLELGEHRAVSASALCQARRKIEPLALRELVRDAAARFESAHGAQHRWHGLRALAVDGSRFTTQRSRSLAEAFGVPTGGFCPQISVSTLFDVTSKVPLDVSVSRTPADERGELIEEHLELLGEGDVVVLDRGYPSFEVLCYLEGSGAHWAVRVPVKSGFPAVTNFVASSVTDCDIEITVPAEYRAKDVPPLRARAVRIERAEGDPIVVLTSLPRGRFGVLQIQELYHLRWGVEEYYKLTKAEYLTSHSFHARSPEGVEQEVYCVALFVSITRHLMAAAAAENDVPYEQVGQKRSMLAVADHLLELLLLDDASELLELISTLAREITDRLEPRRPGRRHPRRRFRPQPKWTAHGRRGGA